MIKIKMLFCLLIAAFSLDAQVTGEWTWINGVNTLNYVGNYGIMGLASSTNKPPGVYEGTEWTDDQGNFWFYGGTSQNGPFDDLWKYEVATNQWTWVKGSGGMSNVRPNYGIQGVASMANSPGSRTQSESWKDNQGNLWLFGGLSYYDTILGNRYNDLWKYNISTNMWTWMKGDSLPSLGYIGSYGTKGIETALNNPPAQDEMGLTWTGNNDNLYLLDLRGCLWKYKIPTNNWTWINGDTNGVAVYGQKGIPSINNTPGHDFFAYTRWTDSNHNFWLYSSVSNHLKGIFKYEVNTNMWAWVWGDTTSTVVNNSRYSDSICDYSFNSSTDNVIPHSRYEARACWIDACDNLWLMGGISNYGEFNDLVYFDTSILKWIWAANDTVQNYGGSYGTMGVSSPTNKPRARAGALPFKDINGDLWVYGGLNDSVHKVYADLWRYKLNMGCPPCYTPLVDYSKENFIENEFTVYPNPLTYLSNVIFTANQKNTTVKLSDLFGNEVGLWKIKSSNKLEIHKGNLKPGIYFIQTIDSDNIITSKKIIIQ